MLKVLVSCANGSGTSLMMKMKAEKVFSSLGMAIEIHHCSLSEGKSTAGNYDVCLCPLNFVEMFSAAASRGTFVIGIKNVISEAEIKEKVLASGCLEKFKK